MYVLMRLLCISHQFTKMHSTRSRPFCLGPDNSICGKLNGFTRPFDKAEYSPLNKEKCWLSLAKLVLKYQPLFDLEHNIKQPQIREQIVGCCRTTFPPLPTPNYAFDYMRFVCNEYRHEDTSVQIDTRTKLKLKHTRLPRSIYSTK